MRTIRGRLIAQSLALVLGGVALVWAGTLWSANNTFSAYVQEQHQERAASLLPSLQQFYLENGSWAGVGSILQSVPGPQTRGAGRRGMGKGPGPGAGASQDVRMVLIDAAGRTVFDSYPQGGTIPSVVAESGLDVVVNGEKSGTLIVTGTAGGVLGTLEEAFFSRFRWALTLVAAGTVIVALALGVRLAANLSAPIERLRDASIRVASGHTGEQVDVFPQKVPEEIRDLVQSFNAMSAELKATEQKRKDLLRDLAHEIRTPLTILSGNLEALTLDSSSPDPDAVAAMSEEVSRLTNLVSGLTTLDEASSGGSAQPRPVSPETLLERATGSIQAAAAARSITVGQHVEPGLRAVWVDPDQVQQVFANILSNALRYVEAGGSLDLSARGVPASPAGNGERAVVFRVRNSGPAIPGDQLGRVFERFFRGDPSRSRATGGSGLGLAIAKDLVEGWGGRIWAENAPEGGAAFSFTAPEEKPPRA